MFQEVSLYRGNTKDQFLFLCPMKKPYQSSNIFDIVVKGVIKIGTFLTILIIQFFLRQIQAKKHLKLPKHELDRILIKGRKEET